MEVNKSNKVKSVSFQGYQHVKTETGSDAYKFNCMYNSKKYDCELQVFRVGFDNKKNMVLERGQNNSLEPCFKTDVPKTGIVIEPNYDLDLGETEPIACRFALKNKETGKVEKYVREDGVEIDGCFVIPRKGTSVFKQGPMYLPLPDSFAPGVKYADFKASNTGEIIHLSKAEAEAISKENRKAKRTFSNILGGTMAGIEEKIPELSKHFTRIIPTPLNGGDSVSSHGYWNENNFLTAKKLGNINNYKSLVRTAGKYGMNLVEDGTFTSEGLKGIHLQRAIKWMDREDKPAEYYYFRMTGILNDSLKMGVVPKNYENLSHKIVNSPFEYVLQKDGSYKEVKNKNYDSRKPTILQVFDSSMVTEEEKNDTTKVIKKYSKLAPDGDNKLAINSHDETLVPYSFEIDPYEYSSNIKNLNDLNSARGNSAKIEKESPRGTLILGAMSGIEIAGKSEGGFECWNAYTDMAKYNYFASNYDDQMFSSIKDPAEKQAELGKLRRANCELQDMATSVARYRTSMVRNVLNEYVAKTIGDVGSNPSKASKRLTDLMNTQNPDKPILPEEMRLPNDVVKNIFDDNYEFREKSDNYNELLVSSLMDLPLDSIEFASDTQGALSSPYLSKRSPDNKHIGQTRYEAKVDETYVVPEEYQKTYNKMNSMFENGIKDFADKVLKEVDKTSKEPLFDGDKVTEYGQYVIPMVAQDIAKYALVKSLMPDAKVKQIANGEIAYDYDDMMERGTLRAFGVVGDSQKDEANQLVNRIGKGLGKLEDKDIGFVAESINKRIKNTNLYSFKLAEAMVDRSGLGLDWRFDAAKDVADVDSVRNGRQHFDTMWKNNIKFWGNMVDAIKKENPHSYTVAELTDIDELVKKTQASGNDSIIYDSENKAIGALLDLGGIISEANYSYFFDGITNMFGRDFTSGYDRVGNQDKNRVNMLEDSLRRFSEKPIDYRRNSYTFASNHDKPRLVHCLSMDMELFHSDLTNPDNVSQRAAAYMIMNDVMNKDELKAEDWDKIKNDKHLFDNISPRAVANGQMLRNGIGKALDDMRKEELSSADSSKREEISEKYDKIYSALSKSVGEVVSGDYYKMTEGKNPEDGFENYKRVLESDGFGVSAVPDAFDIVVDQAIKKHGLKEIDKNFDETKWRNSVDTRATEVGRVKTRMILRYLSALSGNPTLYYGDELGMSGNEDKSGNNTLQNRNFADWTQVDEDSPNYREDVDNYRKSILEIFSIRKDSDLNRLEALNNGTSYKLTLQNGHEKGASGHKMDFSAVMSQAANGAMSLSVFNPNGVSTDNNIDLKYLRPTDGEIDSIKLNTEKDKITLDPNTSFKNILASDNSEYKVCEENGEYMIKRFVDGKQKPIVLDSITSPDGVMMLYHLPEGVEESRKEQLATRQRAFSQAASDVVEAYRPQDFDEGEGRTGAKLDVTAE